MTDYIKRIPWRIKLWIYKIIGAERHYKNQVANRSRAWGKEQYIGSEAFKVADDIFHWATGISLRHIPNSSKDRF